MTICHVSQHHLTGGTFRTCTQGPSAVEQLKETTNINTSLHVLGLCVSALTEPNRKHIPYRNSVLTRLLQDSLGGNGRTVLVATVHQDPAYAEETRSTLQFASRASKIKVRSVMMLIWEGGGRRNEERLSDL